MGKRSIGFPTPNVVTVELLPGVQLGLNRQKHFRYPFAM